MIQIKMKRYNLLTKYRINCKFPIAVLHTFLNNYAYISHNEIFIISSSTL